MLRQILKLEKSSNPKACVMAWFTVVMLMAVIFVFSTSPDPDPKQRGHFDKVEHFGAYAALAAFMIRASVLQWGRVHLAKKLGIVVTTSSLYGLFNEWYQTHVPGRSGDLLDFLANTIGAAAAAIVLYWILRGE